MSVCNLLEVQNERHQVIVRDVVRHRSGQDARLTMQLRGALVIQLPQYEPTTPESLKQLGMLHGHRRLRVRSALQLDAFKQIVSRIRPLLEVELNPRKVIEIDSELATVGVRRFDPTSQGAVETDRLFHGWQPRRVVLQLKVCSPEPPQQNRDIALPSSVGRFAGKQAAANAERFVEALLRRVRVAPRHVHVAQLEERYG